MQGPSACQGSDDGLIDSSIDVRMNDLPGIYVKSTFLSSTRIYVLASRALRSIPLGIGEP